MRPARPKRTRLRARVKQAAKLPRLGDEQCTELEDAIGYKFKDRSLLDRAMTHSSAVQEHGARFSYERLEFLGDRVLGLVIANLLFEKFEGEPEGGLAPRLNALVNRDALPVSPESSALIAISFWTRLKKRLAAVQKPQSCRIFVRRCSARCIWTVV